MLLDDPVREVTEVDDHFRIEELEAHADKTDIREGLSILLSVLAAGAAITAVGLVIAFNGGNDEPSVTQPAAQAPAVAPAASEASHEHGTPYSGKVEEFARV